ncbi:MAG: hypothetical protein ACK5IQ_03175 [Bacteroidales bacterium]
MEIEKSIEDINKEIDSFSISRDSFFQFNYLELWLQKQELAKYIVDSLGLSVENLLLKQKTQLLAPIDNMNAYAIINKSGFIRYMWNKFNRSTQKIENFLTETDKRQIYSILKKDNRYYTSALSTMAQALILAYWEIQDWDSEIKDKVEDILYAADSDDVCRIFDVDGEYYKLVSENVKKVLRSVDREYFADYPYSFWIRRWHEGNSEAVYELIKEFHANLSAKN